MPPALTSWGQVFDMRRRSANARWALPQLTSRLTCWGPGRVNVGRAPVEVVADACRAVISEGAARQIARDYRDDPRVGLKRLIERSGANSREQRLLTELLTEQSACYSLWISAGHGRTRFQQFVVAERDEEGVLRTREFLF